MSTEMTHESEGVAVDESIARELVGRAREEGVSLVGPGGLLTDLTKSVLETALEAAMDDHLGYANTRRRAVTAAIPATAPGSRRS